VKRRAFIALHRVLRLRRRKISEHHGKSDDA
jgi:hypothetical protein